MPGVAGLDGSAVWALLFYSLCSSVMLVVNKLAMGYLPSPSILTLLQLATCCAFIFGINLAYPGKVDALEWAKVKPYLIYIATFSAGLYTNMKALERSNVDTVVVFRCCTPLVVAMMDSLFLGRELPGTRSLLSLLGLLVGAAGYVMADDAFRLDGVMAYFWVFVYFWLLCGSMTYGKLVVDAVPMRTMWGPTLYSNLLSIPPTFLFGAVAGELSFWKSGGSGGGGSGTSGGGWTLSGMLVVALSCVIGVGISYSGWSARNKVSATTYTLVGVLNKIGTVAINTLIWDHHASALGLFFLLVCIVCGMFYQQAPMRPKQPPQQQGHSPKM